MGGIRESVDGITFAAKGIQALMLYNGSGRAMVAEEWLASFRLDKEYAALQQAQEHFTFFTLNGLNDDSVIENMCNSHIAL